MARRGALPLSPWVSEHHGDHAGSAHTRPFPALPALTSEVAHVVYPMGAEVTWETLHEHQRQCARSSSSIMLRPTGSATESARMAALTGCTPRLFLPPYQAHERDAGPAIGTLR